MTKDCGFSLPHCPVYLLRIGRKRCSVQDSDLKMSMWSNAVAVPYRSYFDTTKMRLTTIQARRSGKSSVKEAAQPSSLRQRMCFKCISAAVKNYLHGIYFFVSKRPFLNQRTQRSQNV